jgi:tRNA G18 (ribose-2'-O)-methylase SpoU
MRVTAVDSLDIPGLEPYRTLKGTPPHWRDGFFVAEGGKVVLRLLESDYQIVSFLLSPDWYRRLSPGMTGERFADVDVFVAPERVLDAITGFALHQRVMALGRIPENPPIEMFKGSSTGGGIHVAVEGIADAENMGMIVRNCAAFGTESLITGPDSSSPYMRRSVRVSMGAIFSLRTRRVPDLLEALRELRTSCGWRIIGATPRGGVSSAESLLGTGDSAPLCLLFGSEGRGLSDRALSGCDALFSIPMRGAVDSLNVANALAVTLYAFLQCLQEARAVKDRS